jgi:hypothetical protein
MSYRFYLAGLEVQCDSLAELLEAVKSGQVDEQLKSTGSGPKRAWEAAHDLAEREGISPVEAHGRLAATKPKQEPNKGPQGRGPKKAWAEAQDYAEKHGVSTIEARGILAAKKKSAVQKALNSLQENKK